MLEFKLGCYRTSRRSSPSRRPCGARLSFGVPPSSGPRGSYLAPVPGAVPQPQRPRGRYEDEAERVPCTEAGNLRYNHLAFPFELIPLVLSF